MSGRQYVTYNFLRCFSMVTILQLKRPSIVPHVRPTTNTLNRMNLGPAAAKRTSIAPPKQAATPGLPQTNEDKRTSLLDVTRESLARQGKTFQLYRVIVCGKIENPDRKPEIAAHYQKFFKLYQTETELITGMLFLLQDTYLHILEGTERVVMAFLRTLRGILPSAYARTPDSLGISASGSWSGYFTNSKVLLMMDDAPIRCFGFWASRTVDVRPGMPPVYIDEGMYNEDNVETTIASICVGLAGIGTSLSELSKTDFKAVMEDISLKYEDVIPRNETIRYISDECRAIPTVETWAEIFDAHMEPTSASEHVWPAPTMISV